MGVMNIKSGTKAWREPQPNDIQKGSGAGNNMTPEEMQKMGADNVGEYLNKIADPNYVDPSKKMRAVGSDKLDKDAFMKLMLAQMKQQDPTNPLKSHEMAAQLAQFSQLEQMTNMATSLEALKEGQKPTESFQALNFIGKWVSGDSAKVMRAKGDKDHDFNFQLGKDADTVTIKIRDERGDIVRTTELKQLKGGDNAWVWNGKKDNGTVASAGEYQIMVEAKEAKGQKIAVNTGFEGAISGVQYTLDGPVLMVGTQSIKLKDVRKIVDPATREKEKAAQAMKAQATAVAGGAAAGAAPGAGGAPGANPAMALQNLPPELQAMAAQAAKSNGMSLAPRPAQPTAAQPPAAAPPSGNRTQLAPRNDQKSTGPTSSPLSAAAEKTKMEEEAGAPDKTPEPRERLLSEVGLSSEMKKRLEKETSL